MKLDRPPFKNFKIGDFPSAEEFDTVELKYDGWWCQLELTDGVWRIWSRSGELKKFDNLKYLYDYTMVHGEYAFGTEWSKDRDWIYDRIILYGADFIDGKDVRGMSLLDQRYLLKRFIEQLQKENIRRGVQLIEQYPIAEAPALWEKYVIGEQYEGLVFKNANEPFRAPMGRMKNDETMDYVVIDIEMSDSDTYAGWGARCIVGGLFVKGELVQKCRVSGLTNEWRRELIANKSKYIGRVFEAKGKKISKKGSLRHPDFVRFRDDKLPDECTWDK